MRFDGVWGDRPVHATDFGIAKAMESESRLEGDGHGVGQDELILLFCAAQVLRVEFAGGVERFRMADHDVLGWFPRGAQANHSGGIGAEVHHVSRADRVGFDGADGQRGQYLHHLDPVVTRSNEPTTGSRAERHRDPIRVIECDRVPVAVLVAQVGPLAHLQIVEPGATAAGHPAVVSCDGQQLTRGVMGFQLAQQGGRVTVAVAAPRANCARVPTIAEPDHQYVFTLMQQWRDVVRLVLNAAVVVSPAWCQSLVADTRALDRGFVKTQGGDVKTGALRHARQAEPPTQRRCRSLPAHLLWLGHQIRLDVGDPARRPAASRPISKAAGVLHTLSNPSVFQTRTRQEWRWRDTSGGPAYATYVESAPSLWPLSQVGVDQLALGSSALTTCS